jgi:cyclopropane fatty-acyl-phospholipid synthase-like methyltransferase
LRKNDDIAGREFWQQYWTANKTRYRQQYVPPCFESWSRYLPKQSEKTCLEIGCYPGRNLIFLHKRFGYRVIGVDYCSQFPSIKDILDEERINNYQVFHTDFMDLSINIQADIVISLGFVEHFNNYEYIIQKHVMHTKESGILVIIIPNFRYFQYILHNIFDAPIIKKHVLDVMHPSILSNTLVSCGVNIIECNYVGTFDWWCESYPKSSLGALFKRKLYDATIRIKKALEKRNLHQKPNRWLSPWIMCIARKPDRQVPW